MLALLRIFRLPPNKFFVLWIERCFCPPTPLPRVTSGVFEHWAEVMEALEVVSQRHERPLQRHLLQTAQEEVPETKQIRWEQQRSVAIDIYETIGPELLEALNRPITGPVSKMSQAFSFSSLSGTTRRAAPQDIFLRRNSSC